MFLALKFRQFTHKHTLTLPHTHTLTYVWGDGATQQSRLLLLSNLHKKFSISSFAFDLIDHQVWQKKKK